MSQPVSRRVPRRRALGLILGAGLAARPLVARTDGTLPAPSGKPILTISGKIRAFNEGETARFDRAGLEALGTSGFVTRTPWYKEPTRFDGVRMDALMRAVGAYGDEVVAVALNDYSTEIPIGDFARFGVLLALRRDGEYMPVRDKGPLFIVYPFDSNPDLQRQLYYSRSAWQVTQIVVK